MGIMKQAKETPSAHEKEPKGKDHPGAGKETPNAHEKEPKKKHGGKETPNAHEPGAKKHPSAVVAPPAAASEAPEESAQPAADDDSDAGDVAPASDSDEGGDGDSGGQAPPDSADDSQPQGDGEQADAGGEQPQGGAQPDGSDQAQGPTPVPNPAAPGAGDDTSGGGDTPDQGPETPGEDNQAGPGAENSLPNVPMSPGLQDEYERANAALMKALYSMPGDGASKAVLSALDPQGPGKIRGPVHISLLLLTQLHKQLGDFPPQLVLPFLKDVVAHVMDLGEQVKQIQYSDQEGVAILGSAYEGALRIFGVSKGNVKNLVHHIGQKTMAAHAAKHKEALAFAKPGIDAARSQNGQAAGPTQTAGPQSGAQPGAEATPTAGAAPQQPAPQGGMLQQAAAASPAAQGEEA